MATRITTDFVRVFFENAAPLSNIEESTIQFVRENYVGRCFNGMFVVNVKLLTDVSNILVNTNTIMHSVMYKYDVQVELTGVMIAEHTFLTDGLITDIKSGLLMANFFYNHSTWGKIPVMAVLSAPEGSNMPSIGSTVSCTVNKIAYNPNTTAIRVIATMNLKLTPIAQVINMTEMNIPLFKQVSVLYEKHMELLKDQGYAQKCEAFVNLAWEVPPRTIENRTMSLIRGKLPTELYAIYNPHNIRDLEILTTDNIPKSVKKNKGAINHLLMQIKINMENMVGATKNTDN